MEAKPNTPLNIFITSLDLRRMLNVKPGVGLHIPVTSPFKAFNSGLKPRLGFQVNIRVSNYGWMNE